MELMDGEDGKLVEGLLIVSRWLSVPEQRTGKNYIAKDWSGQLTLWNQSLHVELLPVGQHMVLPGNGHGRDSRSSQWSMRRKSRRRVWRLRQGWTIATTDATTTTVVVVGFSMSIVAAGSFIAIVVAAVSAATIAAVVAVAAAAAVAHGSPSS